VVLIQADPAVDIDELPSELLGDQDIWRARSMAALRRGDYHEELACARSALVSGPRSADALLIYVRALIAESESEPDRSKHTAAMQDLQRVAKEALDMVDDFERPQVAEELLLAEAVASLALGEDDRAMEQLRGARRVPGHSYRPTMLLARILRDAGRSAEALAFVDEEIAASSGPELRLVRAGLLVALGRQQEAAKELESIPSTGTVLRPVPLLLEVAIDAGLTSFAESILDSPDTELPVHAASVFRARIRRLDRNLEEAERWYERSLRDSPSRERAGISLEFAQLLSERRKYQQCCAVLEQFDGLRLPESAPLYTRCLLFTRRFNDAQVFLDGLGERSSEPWALRARANIAIAVGDWAAAVTALQKLRRLDPSDMNVAFNLAVGLARVGDREDARSLLEELVDEVASGDELAQISSLFGLLGDHAEARRTAFRAVRRDQDNADIQVYYLGCFVGRPGAGPELSPSKVGAECWVRLRDVDRDGLYEEYLILSEEPVSATNREFLLGDAAVADLIGRSVGDRIERSSGPGPARELEIVELKHAFVHLFQQIAELYPNRFPALFYYLWVASAPEPMPRHSSASIL